ncbi:universal stress protein [Streptomyces tauricus]|uniref:universal stress protein n=1 Tax=Streptomyces tauricus TaxID=68274 RepID=UPI00387F06C5
MSGQRVIVVAVGRSAHGRAAADWAAREALRRGLPLRVIHVVPPDALGAARPGLFGPGPVTDPESVVDDVAAELTGRHPELRLDAPQYIAEAVPEPSALCRDAEIVVLGLPSRHGSSAGIPGSTVRQIADASTRPVVLVPDGPVRASPAYRPSRITVGVDARDPAGGAIGFAFGTARRWHARLRVLHAWTLPPSTTELPFSVPEEDRATWEDHEVQLLSDAVRPWRAKYPDVPIVEDVVLFSPAEALVRNPGNSELVVVGGRNPYGHGSGLSATAESLLRHATCPVAVVPG